MGKLSQSVVTVACTGVIAVWCSTLSPLAFAKVDEGTVPKSAEELALDAEALQLNWQQEQLGKKTPVIPASEVFLRTQSVLGHYSVPVEKSYQTELDSLSYRQSQAGIERALPFFDFRSQFKRFFSISPDTWSAAQDRDSRLQLDHSVALSGGADASDGASEDRDFESSRLLHAARTNPPDRLLSGLKIAIDPGHMGGDLWDSRTGKFVRDRKTGRKVSEGVINLQTALLLEKRLRAQGAEVFLTRRSLKPVTSLSYETLSITDFGRTELRQSSLENWFQQTLSSYSLGAALFKAFDARPEVRKIFGEFSRSKYFISRADLEARAEAIESVQPDITLYIHYDTTDPPGDPTGIGTKPYNATKVYVPGAFDQTEFASREDRSYFSRHLLQSSYWWQSVRLSQSIVQNLSSGLKIPLAPYGGEVVRQVVPGVFARNLALTKRAPRQVSAFLECMFYNTQEFPRLYDAKNPMEIDGRNVPYSDRLVVVADSIHAGVLGYVNSLRASR